MQNFVHTATPGNLRFAYLRASASSAIARTGRFISISSNPLQQYARRFILRVSRHELAFERALQDTLSETGGALEVRVDLNLCSVHYRHSALDFIDDLELLS